MALVVRNSRARNQGGTVDESDIHHPLLELRLTPDRGLGLFAKKIIKRGVRLLSETPLLVVVSKKGPVSYLDLRQELVKLSPAQLETLYDLQHNPKLLRPKLEAQIRDYAEFARKFVKDDAGMDHFVDCQIKVKAIFDTNATALRNKPGTAIFPLYSRANHSCTPNVYANYNPQLGSHTVHTIRDIHAGEEILTAYIDIAQASDEREENLAKRGVTCQCPACLPGDAFVTSERRRQRIFDFKRCSYAYEGDQVRASDVPAYIIPRNPIEALDRAHEIIKLLLQEGLLGMELAQAYRWASKYSLQSGMLEKAKAFAQKEAEVELYCLGKETGYMSEPSNAAGWTKQLEDMADKDKVKFKMCEKRMMKEAKRLDKKAEKKAKKR